MKLHYRLWIVFSLIWLAGSTILYVFIANIYNERALDNQKEVAFSQGYAITGRISSLIPSFSDRAEGYLDYYSQLFGLRLMLLSPEKELTYDSFKQLSPGSPLKLSILEGEMELPESTFNETEAFGFVQYTLFPIDRRISSGYLLMVKDANFVAGDMNKFRNQMLISLGIATVGSFLIFYFLSAWFTRPIRRIMWHLQQITPQSRVFAMRYRGKDEIGQLVNEIKQMVQQVNEYEQRQRRFISTSSHELKTPLTTMQLILENLPSLRENETLHQEYLTDLQLQIDKMRATVQGMLDVYRLADKPLKLESLRFQDVRRHIEEQFQHVADSKNIALHYEHDVPLIVADSDLFIRAVDNLISNAIRYSPEDSNIRISLNRADRGRIRFSVCDEGSGIATEELSYVFEPFYRSSEATRWSQEGSGLGLAIVKQMMDLHGGEIDIVSEHGRGTCIHLYLYDKTVTR